jgi:hypothetical protein
MLNIFFSIYVLLSLDGYVAHVSDLKYDCFQHVPILIIWFPIS